MVELIALEHPGIFLALERSFAEGVGNNIRLYEVLSQDATDISDIDSLLAVGDELSEVNAVEKNLLLDFSDLGITLDNIEGMTLGPVLPDGRQSLIVVSDNNFRRIAQLYQASRRQHSRASPSTFAVDENGFSKSDRLD